MAESGKPEKQPEKKTPVYHVCQVDPAEPAKITVIAPNVPAPTQEKAMDKVASKMPGEFTLAAFLAGSLRSKKYKNEMKPSLSSEQVELDFAATSVSA